MGLMRKIRVMMVSNLYLPNQFSRALERYPEVMVIHESGDRKGPLPLNCDAAFLCISHLSHAKYWQAKDEYKKAGKPVFAARNGFSETKSQFEEWLDGRVELLPEPPAIVKRGPTALELAMQNALKQQADISTAKQPEKPAKEKVMKHKFPRDPQSDPRYVWVATYLLVRHAAGDSASTIAKKLTAMGSLTYGMNKAWDGAKVSSTVYNLRKNGFVPRPELIEGDVPDYVAVNKNKPKPEKITTPKPASSTHNTSNDTTALAQLLLDSEGITTDKKLEMLKVLLK